jgi:hypothetical protein
MQTPNLNYASVLHRFSDLPGTEDLIIRVPNKTMTDEKADQLIKNGMAYQKQREELIGKYYERVKQELDAITAARFVFVEHQLVAILEIASSLPVANS